MLNRTTVSVVRGVLLEGNCLHVQLAVHCDRGKRHSAFEGETFLRFRSEGQAVGSLGVLTRAQLPDLHVDGGQRGLERHTGEEIREKNLTPGDADLVDVQSKGLRRSRGRLVGRLPYRRGFGQQRLDIRDARLLPTDRQFGRFQGNPGEVHLLDKRLDRRQAEAELGNPDDRAALLVIDRHFAQADIASHDQGLTPGFHLLDERDDKLCVQPARRHGKGQEVLGDVGEVVWHIQVAYVDVERRLVRVGEGLCLSLDCIACAVGQHGQSRLDERLHIRRDVRHERDADGEFPNGVGLLNRFVLDISSAIDDLDVVDREAHRLRGGGWLRLRTRQEVREVVRLVRTADQADERLGEADLPDHGCPSEQRVIRFEVHVQLFKGREGLRPLRLLYGESPHCGRKGEWIESDLSDRHVSMEGGCELRSEDRLQDGWDDEKADDSEDNEECRRPDQQGLAVTYEALDIPVHGMPPRVTLWSERRPGESREPVLDWMPDRVRHDV